MLIVVGSWGGGKSSLFPISRMETDAFSTDLRAANLLGEALGVERPVWLPEPGTTPVTWVSVNNPLGNRSPSSTITLTGD
jgi:hypothetical protein